MLWCLLYIEGYQEGVVFIFVILLFVLVQFLRSQVFGFPNDLHRCHTRARPRQLRFVLRHPKKVVTARNLLKKWDLLLRQLFPRQIDFEFTLDILGRLLVHLSERGAH